MSPYRHTGVIVTSVETGVHIPILLTWIPFFNGMTDAVRYLPVFIRHGERYARRYSVHGKTGLASADCAGRTTSGFCP